MAQSVKNLSAMQETREMSPDPIPGSERSLEEEMAIHSSILAWEIPWREESMESQRVGHGLVTKQQQMA